MKTRILLFTLALIFLGGCYKDESLVSDETKKLQNLSSFYRMDLRNYAASCPIDIVNNMSCEYLGASASQNHSVNGHFSPLEGWTCSVSGMMNNGGIHGNATIMGPPAGFQMETHCMTFDGNEVVYGGIITQVFYQDDFFIFLEPGLYVAFKVKDMGEGQQAPPDQVATYIWFWDDSICQYLPPSSEDWGPMIDVLGAGDQIQVK